MAHSSGVTIHLPHPPNGAGVPPATDEKSDPCEDDGLMGPIEPNDARFEAQLKVLLALPHQQWALISGASSDPWHFSHIRYLACLPDEVYVRPLSHHTSVTTISHHTISYHTISDHHQSAVSYSAAMTLTLPMNLTLPRPAAAHHHTTAAHHHAAVTDHRAGVADDHTSFADHRAGAGL